VFEAPDVIQTAAAAVVRIETAQSSATGAFISASGLLITNSHVLGIGVCPLEGCYARITRMYQRRAVSQQPETVYIVVKAVDPGLDVAVVQAFAGAPSGSLVDSPSYLTMAPRDPASLVGTHVNVIGHPEGRLKKWSEGEVVHFEGSWVWTTAFILPGNSGSPILDDSGRLVGLLHRGPKTNDAITSDGVNEFSVGTASGPIVGAMTAPLPAALRSASASTTDADVVAHQLVYLNAQIGTAVVDGAPKPVLNVLADACDAGLARANYESPEDLAGALEPCFAAELWCECRSDVSRQFAVCPDLPADWLHRYQAVYDHWRAFNGSLVLNMVTFAPAALAASAHDGLVAAAKNLAQALADADPPIDFGIASVLAALDIPIYRGTRMVDFLRGYKSVPDYALSGTQIADTTVRLGRWGVLGAPDVLSLLQDLAADGQIELGTKLYVEQLLHDSNALD
jgi:V8-like Glu-specific endopeptidase